MERSLCCDRPIILCEVLNGLTEQALHELFDAERYRYYRISDSGIAAVDRIVGDPTYRFLNFLFVPVEREADVVRRAEAAFRTKR